MKKKVTDILIKHFDGNRSAANAAVLLIAAGLLLFIINSRKGVPYAEDLHEGRNGYLLARGGHARDEVLSDKTKQDPHVDTDLVHAG